MPTTQFNSDAMVAQIRQAAMQGIVRGTEAVRTEALRLILQTTKSGRIYRRRGVTHQASAPGEPPASDTGRLVNSITTSFDSDRLAGRVTARTAYAAFLEFGTQKMEPRPFMRPALANMREQIESYVRGAVGRVIRG